MRRKTQSGPTSRVWGAGSGDGAGELHFPLVPRCGRCTWKQCLPWAPRGPSQEAALPAAGGPSLWPQSQEFCLLHSRRGWARLPQVTLPWTVGSWCLPRPDPLSVHTPAASHFRLTLEPGRRPSRRVSQLVLCLARPLSGRPAAALSLVPASGETSNSLGLALSPAPRLLYDGILVFVPAPTLDAVARALL